jgi:hypothetical protein
LKRFFEERQPFEEFCHLNPRYEDVTWIQSYEGRQLDGYIWTDDNGGRVKKVRDLPGRGLKDAVIIGQVYDYPHAGAAVFYGSDGMLYLAVDEDEGNVSAHVPPEVTRWVPFESLLENPEDVL